MFGAILGAGVSLLGGLIQNSAENSARRDQRSFDLQMYEQQKKDNSFVERRKDAEAAGLNPFMALTGGGGYRSSFSSGGPTGYVPPLAAVGDGLQMVGDLVANYDPDGLKRAKSESDMRMMLMQAQLQNIEKGTRGSRSMGVPKADHSYDGKAMDPDVEAPKLVNPFPKHWGLEVNPNYPNAEGYEEFLGDYGGSVLGTVINVPATLYHNFYGDVRKRKVDERQPELKKRYDEIKKKKGKVTIWDWFDSDWASKQPKDEYPK